MPTLAEQIAANKKIIVANEKTIAENAEKAQALRKQEGEVKAEIAKIAGTENSKQRGRQLKAQEKAHREAAEKLEQANEDLQRANEELAQKQESLEAQLAAETESPISTADVGGIEKETEVQAAVVKERHVDVETNGANGGPDERKPVKVSAHPAVGQHGAFYQEGANAQSALGLADLHCPFEAGWQASKLAPQLQSAQLPAIQNYLLLSLIREALYLSVREPLRSITEISRTHDKEVFDELLLRKVLAPLQTMIEANLKKHHDAETAWMRIADRLQSPKFQKELDLNNAAYLQRLPNAFLMLFQAFRCADNGFGVDATVLAKDSLEDVLTHATKALFANTLFYTFSMHVHYDAPGIASRHAIIANLKQALSKSTDFTAIDAVFTARTRVSQLEKMRHQSNGFTHSVLTTVSFTDPNGNFGVMLKRFSEALEQGLTAKEVKSHQFQ